MPRSTPINPGAPGSLPTSAPSSPRRGLSRSPQPSSPRRWWRSRGAIGPNKGTESRLTKNGLARLLARDGISPSTIRTGTGPKDTIKGYKLSQFADAFARYLPETPNQNVTTSQGAENLAFSGIFNPSQPKPCDVSEIVEKAQFRAGCDVVTVAKEEISEILDDEDRIGGLDWRDDP